MTDRGIPAADGAPACPFVAFEDDRDARSTAPDHRHRCFAEPVPAPRAIAHQDAYCLSPAFAVCPTFQDWARREAAAARPAASSAAPAPRPREEETSRPVPMPPVDREARHAPAGSAQPLPPRRPPARDWAAPPPWLAPGDEDSEDDTGTPDERPGAIPGWGAAAAGAAAAAAHAPAPRDADGWGSGSRGLADSPAARLAGPDPDLPTPARPVASWVSPDPQDEDEDPFVPPAPSRPQPLGGRPAPQRSSAAAQGGRPVPPPRTPSPRDGARPAPRDAQELFGPAWERPRRYEAYPLLRTRVGLPSLGRIPGLALAAIALVIAAAFLFFVSPILLGLPGSAKPAASPGASSAASAAPSASVAPTVPPAPTAYVYTVIQGDTLSGIAQKNGVTVKAILAANPQIKNQNSIKIGDQITIPPRGASASGAVSGASPSAVSGASASAGP